LPEEELQLLVRRLERDESHRATLTRYAAIGSVLRNDPLHLPGDEMRQKLMMSLQDEVSGEQAAAPANPGTRSGTKTGSLIAAAVAAIAIIGVYNSGILESRESVEPSMAIAQLQAEGQSAAAGIASRELSPVVVTSRRAGEPRRVAINPDRMTSYLVSHGEYARSFQGAIVDSRVFVQQASFEE